MWCIADAQGKGEEMARELFNTPVEKLTPSNMREIAKRLGCDTEDLDTKIERAIKVIETHIADATEAKVRALPTMYVGGTAFVGAASTEELLAAIDRAAP
jgi:protein-disulfide isomerase